MLKSEVFVHEESKLVEEVLATTKAGQNATKPTGVPNQNVTITVEEEETKE